MLDPKQLARFAPLLKYKDLKLDGLTPEILSDISNVIGLKSNIDETTFNGVLEVLKADNVEGVWDLLGRPETLAKTREFLSPNGDDNMIECPHCHEWFVP